MEKLFTNSGKRRLIFILSGVINLISDEAAFRESCDKQFDPARNMNRPVVYTLIRTRIVSEPAAVSI